MRVRPTDAGISIVGFTVGMCLFPFCLLLYGLSFTPVSILICAVFFPAVSATVLAITLSHFIDTDFSAKHCDLSGNVWRAYALGYTFGLGFVFIFASQLLECPKLLWPFGLYLAVLSFFHWSEFYFTALYNPINCCLDIYMLNHSPEYIIAAAASVLEYWLEIGMISFYYPSCPRIPSLVNVLGLGLCIAAEVLRKAAMATAATNFNHFIEIRRRPEHVLIKHGVYAWFRHPAYVGWFYWALGTQILLGNPLCLIAYAVASFVFFKDRINFEERNLTSFFGEEYLRYQREVPAVTLHTDLGDLKLEVFCMQAPLAAENFLALCASDYYKGCIFHRNIKGFIVQTGDPTGTGKNGQSIWKKKFKDEFHESLRHNARGIVSMANNGPDSNGSQFFITYSKQTMLDMKYSIFAKVIDGWNVLDELERAPVEEKTYRPLTDIHIQNVTIHANPFAE
ncbi:unnamed protein product [Calicophoron daubneyi]|uniref:Protein-S-isoprenylcysteine O-methyltransferase n=1 Tax=Calicophoron daubneyi TaxID=300641 RepID=A0AAV2TQ64_CALDB